MRAWKLSPISSSKATLAQNVVPPAGNENRALPKRRNQMRASRQASTDLETFGSFMFFFSLHRRASERQVTLSHHCS